MVVEINIIKGKTLCSYNRASMKSIQIVFQLRISSCPENVVQLSLYNATTVMNGERFQNISLKFLLIVSMAEDPDVVELHALAEDLALDCYRSVLLFLRTLMELFQVHGCSWIPVRPQVCAITKK